MIPVGFTPIIPASKQPQAHTLEHVVNHVQNCMDPGRIIKDLNLQFSTYQLIFWCIRKKNDEQKRRKRKG